MTTLLKPAQVATQLGYSAKTIRQMCADHQITAVITYGPKGQPRYRIPDQAIEAWIRRHTYRGNQ